MTVPTRSLVGRVFYALIAPSGSWLARAVALELAQVYELRAKLAVDERADDLDLLDFIDMMLATGKRIGETAAITWDCIDVDAGTVEIRAATLLDAAGLTARQIADQLGQSQVSVTQDHYMGRKIASEDAARILEVIGRPDLAQQVAEKPDDKDGD